jgi:hypothetical protein
MAAPLIALDGNFAASILAILEKFPLAAFAPKILIQNVHPSRRAPAIALSMAYNSFKTDFRGSVREIRFTRRAARLRATWREVFNPAWPALGFSKGPAAAHRINHVLPPVVSITRFSP